MQCHRGRMHHWIRTASTKYHYKPEEFGCIKSPRRPVFRQVRLPVSSRTTTAGDLGPTKYPFDTCTPTARLRQVHLRNVYVSNVYHYARRRQDRFGIHQVPLPMTRTSTKTCTTTIAEIARTSTDDPGACENLYQCPRIVYDDRPENVYFLYTAPNLIHSEKARF